MASPPVTSENHRRSPKSSPKRFRRAEAPRICANRSAPSGISGASQRCDVKSGSSQENAYALPRSMNALNTSGFLFLNHNSE